MKNLLRATPGLLLLCGVLSCAPVAAQELNTVWTNTGTGDFTLGSNWDVGVPDVNNYDFGIITNGGTATLNVTPTFEAGGIRLGVGGGETGTLLIQSGGNLTVVDSLTFPADGSVTAGLSGTGILTVSPGGALDSVSLASGGEVGSTITLGGTAAGTTTVTTSDVTLDRTTRIIGPNVSFSATGALTFGETSILQSEITGATHSALATTGTATLGGALEVEFNGYTPLGTDTWNLVDATTIGGSFNGISILGESPLGPGKALAIRTQAGGTNGNVAQLYIAQLLVLTVDRDSGEVSITNPGTTGIELDGYGVRSSLGSLDATDWDSLQDQTVPGWAEANPSPNHIGELNALGTTTLGAGLSWNLGPIFSAATPTEFGQDTADIVFQYTAPGEENIISAVEYTGVGQPNNFVLYVDPTTGDVNLRNTSPFTVDFDGYTIASADGSLQPGDGDWLSLEDQGAEGGTWYESNVSATRVSELQADGVTTLAPNTTFNLGTLFDTTSAQDLIFDFVLAGEEDPMRGVVIYGELPSVGLPGDYNENGVLDAADYSVWRDNLGGTIPNDPTGGVATEADYDYWKANFGATLGSGSGSLAAAAVPEPATWILMCISGVLVLAVRRSA